MKEALILVIFGFTWLFPVLYAYKNDINNKMLFLFSSYGAELIISTLIAGVGVPFYVFLVFMLPQLVELYSQYQWLGKPINWAIDYFWLVTPLLLFVIPHGIYLRYKRFFSNEIST
jgi:hypothetical protein